MVARHERAGDGGGGEGRRSPGRSAGDGEGDREGRGRGDGENYQIGFVDICDTPYPEIIDAARRIGDRMYQLRSGTQ